MFLRRIPWPRRALALAVLLLATPGIGADRPASDAFDAFLARYRVAKPEERSGLVEGFVADRAIEPLVAVMVDAAEDRRTWHYYSADYTEHFARVVAHVDANYATRSDPAERIHAGTSSGGRMALFTGLRRPDLFGRLALLSPELSGPLHIWQPWLGGSEQPDARLSVWLGAGTYERSIRRDAKLLAGLLQDHGVTVETHFTHQGHSFGTWRESAIVMLRHFLTPDRGDATAQPLARTVEPLEVVP